MSKIIQHRYDHFPEDWLASRGVDAVMTRFVIHEDGDMIDENHDRAYETNNAHLIVVIRPDRNTPENREAIEKGIKKVGLPGQWWSAPSLDALPLVENLDEDQTANCAQLIDEDSVEDWYDDNEDQIVFTDAA